MDRSRITKGRLTKIFHEYIFNLKIYALFFPRDHVHPLISGHDFLAQSSIFMTDAYGKNESVLVTSWWNVGSLDKSSILLRWVLLILYYIDVFPRASHKHQGRLAIIHARSLFVQCTASYIIDNVRWWKIKYPFFLHERNSLSLQT